MSIAQSAVTSQIRNLEHALGLNLLNRNNPRRPEITAEGRRVLEYAEGIFESSRELVNWATKGSLPRTQILKIGAISGLSRNLQYEFMQPRIENSDIKFEVTTGDQKNLVSMLMDHELDVVLTSRNVDTQSKVGFYTHVLATSPVIFVCHKTVKLKRVGTIKDKLAGRILFTPGQNFEAKPELDAYLEGLKTPYRLAGEIDDIALLRILSLRSGAIVVTPEMGVKNDIENGDLKAIAPAGKIQQRFYAITRHKLNPNDEVRFLIETLREKSRLF